MCKMTYVVKRVCLNHNLMVGLNGVMCSGRFILKLSRTAVLGHKLKRALLVYW